MNLSQDNVMGSNGFRTVVPNKSPLRVQGTWGNISNMNKSAIVERNENSNVASLPDKLLQMKERVRRDRSANVIAANEHRDTSLYGRSKQAEQISKLRESYNQRKSNRSASGTNSFYKHNFKERAFDQEDPLSKSRGSVSFDRNIGKENCNGNTPTKTTQMQQQLRAQTESQQTQANRFKRTQQKSNMTLANYQQKLERLDQNYKKFATNLINPNQSDQKIEEMKYKTGLSFISKIIKKADSQDYRRAFKLWKLNSGLAVKLYENQEKTIILAKCMAKINQKSLNYVKIQLYQKWKRLVLQDQGTNIDKVMSKFSEIITSTDDFNRCVENDYHLSQLLSVKLSEIIQIVASDLMLFQNDQEEIMKTYHHLSGEQINFSIPSLATGSVLGKFLSRDDQEISITQQIAKDPYFRKEVDMPINQEGITGTNLKETNQFNKIRNLSMVLIKMPSKIGILRLYFNGGVGGTGPTQYQMQQVKQIQWALPLFIKRIFDVRTQINTLALNNIDQTQQIRELEFYNQINQSLKHYHQGVLQNDKTDNFDFIDLAKQNVEQILKNQFDMENVYLKQIIRTKNNKEIQLLTNDNKDLVKLRDHIQENIEVIEDFLDHKRDYYIHQISICPKQSQQSGDKGTQFEEFTYVLHIINHYQTRENLGGSMVNLSTSLTISASHMQMRTMLGNDRAYLDQSIKHRLAFFFRNLTPILDQSLTVSQDLMPKITNLRQSVLQVETNYNLQQFLHKFVSEQSLIEERSETIFYFKLRNIMFTACKFFGLFKEDQFDQSEFNFFMFINKSIFHQRNVIDKNQGPFKFASYMEDNHLELFDEYVINRTNSNAEQSRKRGVQTYQIFENEEDLTFKEVGVTQDLLPLELTIQAHDQNLIVLLPIINSFQFHTIAVLAFIIPNEKIIALLQPFIKELTSFCINFIEKRHSYHVLQEKHDNLLQKLQVEKMSQDTKEMIDEHLILPFLKKQTLKALGDGIDYLSERLVSNSGDEMDQFGQEISQIAFMGPKIFIEDVRLISSYSQYKEQETGFEQPDKMMIQSYQQKQQIIYEDELLDKVVIVYPLMSANVYRSAIYQQNAIILRFIVNRDSNVQKKLENIHNQLINCIQPIVDAALVSDIVSVKQTLALNKLCGVIDKYRFTNYREIIYFMRDLKAKNVYNFSRSRLFDKIARSKRVQDLKEEYFDVNDKQLDRNQQIQAMIRDALKVMNIHAYRYKQACFRKFVIGTRQPLYDMNMPKKKKRAVCTLVQNYVLAHMRQHFSRFAVNAQAFKYLSHPKTKYLASVHCIFRNFRIVRERLAFLRLKKNLNLQLRNQMTTYKESDKDLFVQLNQILISSHSQQGGIDGGFAYALSEIFQYLRNISKQESHIRDVGGVADDSFVGHVDEVILTMKSAVYQPQSNSLQSTMNQKLKLFMSQIGSELNLSASQSLNKPNKSLKFSYDQNLDVSQQDQILKQINASNIDLGFSEDIVPKNEFENQLAQSYQKYVISLKRDLIHQMLTKSNGIIFNFQNIQQSLSDIFLSQQSQQKDQNVGNRFAVVRRSKSALIIPLFDVSQQTIIGSFELYKHHQQAFTEEIEARYDYFSKLLGDFFLLYGQLVSQSMQIGQLKWQMQKAIRPVQSLSQFLKNVYVNGPGTHFPGASHVLPIIILNKTCRIHDSSYQGMDNSETLNSGDASSMFALQKLAFFYQFKDNHIYNFEYEGTFIDELLDNGCILEMCKKGAMNADEAMRSQFASGYGNTGDSQRTSVENFGGGLGSSRMGDDGGQYTHRLSSHRHRTIQTQDEKVKSVTNEFFKHIIYYPIFDIQDESKIISIIEVGYKKKENTEPIITEDIQQYLDQFRSLLGQLKVRINSFSRNLENMFAKRQQKALCRGFQQWKQMMIFTQYKEQFQQNQLQALQTQEQCYSEYMQNLDNYGQQLQSVNEDKTTLQKQVMQYSIEKKAKLKFLATSLLSSQNLFKKLQVQRIQRAFLKWQYNVSIRKIAETAFSRVLELNHRHSKARFKTAVFLLQSLVEDNAVKTGFGNILEAAHMRRFNNYHSSPTRDDGIRRSRSRSQSRGRSFAPENTFVLNNVQSLLSPSNLKKIEKKNLYNQQINSLYAPLDNTLNERSHSSAIINAKTHLSLSLQPNDAGLPLIQLQPHQVTKQSESKHKTEGKSASRYSMYQTNANTNVNQTPNNPYDNLELSQIEYTQNKRDYSPIITTSKYSLKKIYEPQVLKETAKSYSTQQPRHKKARSVEGSQKGGNKKQRGAPALEKVLYLKETQLNMMKKHMNKLKGAESNGDLSERRVSFDKVGYSSMQQVHSERPGSSLQHPKLSKKLASKRNTSRSKPERYTPTVQQQIAMFSVDSESQSSIPNRGPTNLSKYAEINGRDVSPPVRDQRRKSTEKVINILHKKYDDMKKY